MNAASGPGRSFSQVCAAMGKPPGYIRTLQSKLGLYIPQNGEGYSHAYMVFLQTVIVLRTFSIPLEDIGDLFETEKKLLNLLKVDSLTPSRTWYLDACSVSSHGPGRLLLTNHDLAHSITPGAVQFNLDFSARDPELFTHDEMGENVRRVFDLYCRQVARIQERVKSEETILRDALAWSLRWFGPPEGPGSVGKFWTKGAEGE